MRVDCFIFIRIVILFILTDIIGNAVYDPAVDAFSDSMKTIPANSAHDYEAYPVYSTAVGGPHDQFEVQNLQLIYQFWTLEITGKAACSLALACNGSPSAFLSNEDNICYIILPKHDTVDPFW